MARRTAELRDKLPSWAQHRATRILNTHHKDTDFVIIFNLSMGRLMLMVAYTDGDQKKLDGDEICFKIGCLICLKNNFGKWISGFTIDKPQAVKVVGRSMWGAFMQGKHRPITQTEFKNQS